MTRKILCYGDSNTWGVIPRWEITSLPSERYDKKTRWTQVMAADLGQEWELIEEGLGGRTTMYQIPGEDYRRGDWYLTPCLLSHRPLDCIVLMLGSNDLQPRMHEQPFTREQMYAGPRRLLELILAQPQCGAGNQPPKILLLAPTPLKLPQVPPRVPGAIDETSVHLSHEFASVYEEIAKEYGCGFLDAGLFACPDDSDGAHFTKESHVRLGHGVAAAVKSMVKQES